MHKSARNVAALMALVVASTATVAAQTGAKPQPKPQPKPQSASRPAQCPPPKAKQQFSGTFTASGQSFRFPLELEPCHDLRMMIATSDNSSIWGASFQLQILNREGVVIDTHHWSTLEKATKDLPLPSYGSPYQGTSGGAGHPHEAVLSVTSLVASEVRWTVTFITGRRPRFNTGGSSFDSATLISAGTELHGNLHHWEPGGQNFKLSVPAGASIALTGTIARQTVGSAARFRLSVYNDARQQVRAETGLVSADTSPRALPEIAFTNMHSTTATYYLRIAVEGGVATDFVLNVTKLPGSATP